MKIVAGNFGGRNIKTLTTYDTRPTSAKVRGAIFNALGQYFLAGNVLDLFSGSGAMAIEALSRGCQSATAVDNNRAACRIIEENRQALKIDHTTLAISCTDYQVFLRKSVEQYDLIFVDPPYKMKVIQDIVELIFSRNLLADDGRLILEFSSKNYQDTALHFLAQYSVIFNRRYDATQVVIIEKERNYE